MRMKSRLKFEPFPKRHTGKNRFYPSGGAFQSQFVDVEHGGPRHLFGKLEIQPALDSGWSENNNPRIGNRGVGRVLKGAISRDRVGNGLMFGLSASYQQPCFSNENSSRLQSRVNPSRVNANRCRTCITRNSEGRCIWLAFSKSAIMRDLESADSDAIDYALRAYHLIGLQRLIFGTSLYNKADSFNITFRNHLRNRFKLDIENKSHHRRIGRIEKRYSGVARLLKSGRIRYRCRCSDEAAWAESYNRSARNPRIWICRHFLKNKISKERALTLLHESLHILYGLGHSGTMRNIYRYEEFATDMENIPIPAVTLPTGKSPKAGAEAAGLKEEKKSGSGRSLRPSSGIGDDLHKEAELEEETI